MKAIEVFKPVYFWDCIKEEIDLKDDADFVVERVLSRSLNDDRVENLNKLIKYYPIEFIREVSKNSTQIFGNERIEEISKIIGIKPEEIKTYIPPDFYKK